MALCVFECVCLCVYERTKTEWKEHALRQPCEQPFYSNTMSIKQPCEQPFYSNTIGYHRFHSHLARVDATKKSLPVKSRVQLHDLFELI